MTGALVSAALVSGHYPLSVLLQVELRFQFVDLTKVEPMMTGDIAPVDAGPDAAPPEVQSDCRAIFETQAGENQPRSGAGTSPMGSELDRTLSYP